MKNNYLKGTQDEMKNNYFKGTQDEMKNNYLKGTQDLRVACPIHNDTLYRETTIKNNHFFARKISISHLTLIRQRFKDIIV